MRSSSGRPTFDRGRRDVSALPYPELRRAAFAAPKWTHYVIGVALVLVRHGVIDPPQAKLSVSSDVPQSVGVSSSAALEVADGRRSAPRRRPVAARRAVPGGREPRGRRALRDHGPGHRGGGYRRCGPADPVPAGVRRSTSPLPPGVEVVGWPTGAEHDVVAVPYRRARRGVHGQAHRRGRSRNARGPWVSEPAGGRGR